MILLICRKDKTFTHYIRHFFTIKNYLCGQNNFQLSVARTLYNIKTALPRWWHRHGFGIQSPTDYELVRDVLFEPLHYYAYAEQGLNSEADRQLYRIRLWQPDTIIVSSTADYDRALPAVSDSTVMVIEDISGSNEQLWQRILLDPVARVTFDMRHRGLILFDSKRIKQNYIL